MGVSPASLLTNVELDPIVQHVNPSAEQRPAVTTRGVDVLVRAGAGSGKTRTLVARYLSLVAEGNPLRAVVAITFTDKAALEMRSRLRSAMRDYLQEPQLDTATRTRWEGIARELDSARIGTIHALCTEILRRHPAEARLDPRFAVLDATQALLLRANALDDALAAAVVNEQCAPLFATKKFDDVRKIVNAMLENRLAVAAVSALGDGADIAARAQIEAWVESVCAFIQSNAMANWIDYLTECTDYAQSHERARADNAAPVVRAALDKFRTLADCERQSDWVAMARALAALRACLKQVGVKANWDRLDPKAVIKQMQVAIDTGFGDKLPDLAADERLLALRPLALAIYNDALARYEAAKQELGALDFDDLEAGALNLLRTHTSVRTEWQQQVAALLIDEFQDTNQRQAELVRLLRSGAGRVFMVGDAQQSIYGFRGADLRVFHAERARVESEGGAPYELAISYRTHSALLAATESLLRPIFDGGSAADFRAPFSPLQPNRAEASSQLTAPFVEFHLAAGNKGGAMPCATDGLASRLHALHNQGVEWGQMAILCRRSGAFAHYEDALERAAIPNVTVAGRGFYDRPEVRDILNALHAIADPFDNVALVGLLRSPAVGMTDFAIMQLCDAAPKGERNRPAAGALWTQLQLEAEPRAQEAVTLIRTLNQRAGRVSVAVLLEDFLTRSTYGVALMQAGQARSARNLTKLMDEARAAPSPSVRDFLERIAAVRAVTTHEGEARADESGAVQIMTIHAAKGLEFSVVVIGDASGAGGSHMPALLVDEQAGVFFSTREDEGAEGILFAQATACAKFHGDAESERILYVAATRARDMLIFSGNVSQKADGTCGSSGWLKALSGNSSVQALLDRALTSASTPCASACGRYACIVHTRASADADLAATRVSADAYRSANGADESVHNDAVWAPRMVAPVTSKALPREYAMRAWRVASDPTASEAPAWVIGEIVHEAIAAWRFPDDGLLPEFGAWATARTKARGVHDSALCARAVATMISHMRRLRSHALYAEIANATRRFHELPYQCTMADNLPDNGRIDLLYARPDGTWRVVDFKTSHMPSMHLVAQSVAHHGFDVAMRRYGHAVESLLGERPELLLCYIDTPEGVQLRPVPFDAPAA